MIVTAIYNTADTYFVSKLGTSASGAVGIVMSLMGLIQSLGFMIGMGSGSWMSRLLGEKKDETASKVAASGFYFSLVLGLLVAVMGCCFLDPLVGSARRRQSGLMRVSMRSISCMRLRF